MGLLPKITQHQAWAIEIRDILVPFSYCNPQNILQAKKYMKQLPESQVPIAGSHGAMERQQRLEKQFPIYDIEPSQAKTTLAIVISAG